MNTSNEGVLHGVICNFLMLFPIDHLCDTHGCGSVLVLDGNMKNCRQVCACCDIGELKFAELQGTVVVRLYTNICTWCLFFSAVQL